MKNVWIELKKPPKGKPLNLQRRKKQYSYKKNNTSSNNNSSTDQSSFDDPGYFNQKVNKNYPAAKQEVSYDKAERNFKRGGLSP